MPSENVLRLCHPPIRMSGIPPTYRFGMSACGYVITEDSVVNKNDKYTFIKVVTCFVLVWLICLRVLCACQPRFICRSDTRVKPSKQTMWLVSCQELSTFCKPCVDVEFTQRAKLNEWGSFLIDPINMKRERRQWSSTCKKNFRLGRHGRSILKMTSLWCSPDCVRIRANSLTQ